MSLATDISTIVAHAAGAQPVNGPDNSNVQQSKLVALASIAKQLERYDTTGDAEELRRWKAETELKADLLKAKSQLLAAGVSGASREAVARTNASARVTAEKIGAYADMANTGYDRSYGSQVERISTDAAAFPPGAEKQKAMYDRFVEGLDPTQPGLHRALAQAQRAWGAPVVSPANQAKLANVQATAAGQEARGKELEGALGALTAGGGGSGAMGAALSAIDLLEQGYGLGKMDSVVETAQKEKQYQNLERLQDTYDRLSADVFGGSALDKYGGMTEAQWKHVIGSPQYQRFAKEHGYSVGRITETGEYVAGKQDARAVAALVRAEQGRPVWGTKDRMEKTYVKLDVANGQADPALAWADGKYRVDAEGTYVPEAEATPPATDKFILIDLKGNGYARHPDGSISWVNPGSGTTTLIRDASGQWVKGDPQKMQENFDKDVKPQEAAGNGWSAVADEADGKPLSALELAQRVADGRGLQGLTDDPSKMKSSGPANVQVTDRPPSGAHSVYGRLLPHKPSDGEDVLRVSTSGGPKVFRQQGDVWVAEEDPGLQLGAGAELIAGGRKRATQKDEGRAARGAKDEAEARRQSLPPEPEGPSRQEQVAAMLGKLKAKLPVKEAPAIAEPVLTGAPAPRLPQVEATAGSADALQAVKARRLAESKAALVATMGGTPTLAPARPAVYSPVARVVGDSLAAGETPRRAANAGAEASGAEGREKAKLKAGLLRQIREAKKAQEQAQPQEVAS